MASPLSSCGSLRIGRRRRRRGRRAMGPSAPVTGGLTFSRTAFARTPSALRSRCSGRVLITGVRNRPLQQALVGITKACTCYARSRLTARHTQNRSTCDCASGNSAGRSITLTPADEAAAKDVEMLMSHASRVVSRGSCWVARWPAAVRLDRKAGMQRSKSSSARSTTWRALSVRQAADGRRRRARAISDALRAERAALPRLDARVASQSLASTSRRWRPTRAGRRPSRTASALARPSRPTALSITLTTTRARSPT